MAHNSTQQPPEHTQLGFNIESEWEAQMNLEDLGRSLRLGLQVFGGGFALVFVLVVAQIWLEALTWLPQLLFILIAACMISALIIYLRKTPTVLTQYLFSRQFTSVKVCWPSGETHSVDLEEWQEVLLQSVHGGYQMPLEYLVCIRGKKGIIKLLPPSRNEEWTRQLLSEPLARWLGVPHGNTLRSDLSRDGLGLLPRPANWQGPRPVMDIRRLFIRD